VGERERFDGSQDIVNGGMDGTRRGTMGMEAGDGDGGRGVKRMRFVF